LEPRSLQCLTACRISWRLTQGPVGRHKLISRYQHPELSDCVRLRAPLTKFPPRRIIHNDCASIGERLHRMADTGGHDGHEPRTDDLRHAVNRQLKLALDHFIIFFLGMEMLVNRRAAHEIVVREGHARRVEIGPCQPGKRSMTRSLLTSTMAIKNSPSSGRI